MNVSPKVRKIITSLNLSPHPEGGYYRETYKSEQKVRETNNPKERAAATGIYFLLPEGVSTNWHRVSSDELWHFYTGDELVLEVIDKEQRFQKLTLGNALTSEADFQHLVPQNCWQRAYSTGRYTLVGCTVSPGFEFEDFEMVEEYELAKKYTALSKKIVSNPFSNK